MSFAVPRRPQSAPRTAKEKRNADLEFAAAATRGPTRTQPKVQSGRSRGPASARGGTASQKGRSKGGAREPPPDLREQRVQSKPGGRTQFQPEPDQEAAATKIQSSFRGKKARQEVAAKRKIHGQQREREVAATKIQSGFRGKKARREVDERREAKKSRRQKALEASPDALFDIVDANGDDAISRRELSRAIREGLIREGPSARRQQLDGEEWDFSKSYGGNAEQAKSQEERFILLWEAWAQAVAEAAARGDLPPPPPMSGEANVNPGMTRLADAAILACSALNAASVASEIRGDLADDGNDRPQNYAEAIHQLSKSKGDARRLCDRVTELMRVHSRALRSSQDEVAQLRRRVQDLSTAVARSQGEADRQRQSNDELTRMLRSARMNGPDVKNCKQCAEYEKQCVEYEKQIKELAHHLKLAKSRLAEKGGSPYHEDEGMQKALRDAEKQRRYMLSSLHSLINNFGYDGRRKVQAFEAEASGEPRGRSADPSGKVQAQGRSPTPEPNRLGGQAEAGAATPRRAQHSSSSRTRVASPPARSPGRAQAKAGDKSPSAAATPRARQGDSSRARAGSPSARPRQERTPSPSRPQQGLRKNAVRTPRRERR